MDLDACFGDTEWTCGWCGVYAIDRIEINHKPDCLWLAAETYLARNKEEIMTARTTQIHRAYGRYEMGSEFASRSDQSLP